MWEAVSERLNGRMVLLEALDRQHADALWGAASEDPSVWNWMQVRGGNDRATFDLWFDAAVAERDRRERMPYVTIVSGAPLGSSSLFSFRPEHRVAEIGHTWLARSAWGTGANTEAKYLMLRHAFDELGCLRVEFKTDAKNARARAALASIPAEFEGIHRRHMLVRGGERRDSAWYSVIDEDWPGVKAALEQRIAARV